MSEINRGRPTLDKAAREREKRRAVLHKGMLACYEVIDMARKELAGIDAAEASGAIARVKEEADHG